MMKFQPVKGMRDFLPQEAILREKVFEKVKRVFERFGFSPAITPSLEYYEVFANKFAIGEENLENIYKFKDKSGRMLALRFDQTVPLARLIANNPHLPKPFKRYEISRVWRYEEIKRGRYREFWQCDIDIVGSRSMLADAEVIACALTAVRELGFENVVMRINNRKILNALLESIGIKESKHSVLRAVDKLDKIGVDGVKRELFNLGLSEEQVNELLKTISIKGDVKSVLEKIKFLEKFGKDGLIELEKLFEYLEAMVDKKYLLVDLSLARGLDYYTSTIFELSYEDKSIGSIAGGGRYDEMIGKFSGSRESIPAVGIALGIERIIELLKEKEKPNVVTQIFVACVEKKLINEAIKVAKRLREMGINVEVDLMERNLDKQLEYADKCKIPFVLMVGEEEVSSGLYKIRDMRDGKEVKTSLERVKNFIKKFECSGYTLVK
ncbi:MAG: histidine--tRNA ligase [Candidatus Aenigmarchaeota archaeon]|nr:histidine--tRNA ligase [Candidatus Aenigmarchaeota archaeon]